MDDSFFIPIDSKNVPVYLAHATIASKRYLSSKIEDLQDRFQDNLLITKKIWTSDNDCSLEIALSDTEKNELKGASVDGSAFLFDAPLPISRIKSIIFSDKDLKDRIVAVTNLSSAFVPSYLPKVLPREDLLNISSLKYVEVNQTKDFTEKVHQYNKILGGLSLLKLSGDDSGSYPENYYSTIALFNTKIEDDIKSSGKSVNNIFHDAFLGKGRFEVFRPYLDKEVTEKDVEQAAKHEGQKIERDKLTGLLNIDSLDKISYILGILFLYGVGDEARAKKVDSLIANNFRNGVKSGRSETVALCYGLNRGYSIFGNRYKVGNSEGAVKFQLNSMLDYYTIESVYQFVFNNIRSSSFAYLDKWIPRLSVSKSSGAYSILDHVVSDKKNFKVGSKEYIQSLLQSLFQKDSIHYFAPFIEFIIKKIWTDIEKQNAEKKSETSSRSLSSNYLNGDSEMEGSDLKKRNDELEELITRIYKEKNIKSIKTFIDTFRGKDSDKRSDLFSK